MTPRILVVTTSCARIPGTDRATGLWIEELTTPWYALADAGADLRLASMSGGAVPIDPTSLEGDAADHDSVRRWREDEALQRLMADTEAFTESLARDVDALLLPGGHGTMWDLPGHQGLARAVARMLAADRVVAAVCHGPAGLVGAVGSDGRPLVSGRRVAAFTNSEERAAGLADAVPFLLESRLRDLGAEIVRAGDWEACAIADRGLVTGQNPASAAQVARLLLAELAARRATRAPA